MSAPSSVRKRALPSVQAVAPVWLRMPAAIQLSGLKATALYKLMRHGEVRYASFCEEGKRKGTRLINSRSLLDFIERHASGGEPPLTPLPAAANSHPELTAA